MDIKFCNNLKSVRKECRYTQKEVALILGVAESCYANWEQGRTEPSIEMLRNLGEIFKIDMETLINGDI